MIINLKQGSGKSDADPILQQIPVRKFPDGSVTIE
jgi:hypothetical protein